MAMPDSRVSFTITPDSPVANWSFGGHISQGALAFGDVDNDGDIELAVGNIRGELALFKYVAGDGRVLPPTDPLEQALRTAPFAEDSRVSQATTSKQHLGSASQKLPTPWLRHSGLCSITAIEIGDFYSYGSNSILVINAEGELMILAVQTVPGSLLGEQRIALLQKIPASLNVSQMLIADIDDNGQNELVLARTDRQIQVFCINVVRKKNLADSRSYRPPSMAAGASPLILPENISRVEIRVELEPKFMHRLHHMVGSMAVLRREGQPYLLVSQSNGSFLVLDRKGQAASIQPSTPSTSIVDPNEEKSPMEQNSFLRSLNEKLTFSPVRYLSNASASDNAQLITDAANLEHIVNFQKGVVFARTADAAREVSTEVVVFSSNLVCTVTSDGIVTIQDFEQRTQKVLKLGVRHQIIRAAALGADRVACCAASGSIYVVDSALNCIHAIGTERVCAFSAGSFTLTPGSPPVPCFVISNFEDVIRVTPTSSFDTLSGVRTLGDEFSAMYGTEAPSAEKIIDLLDLQEF